jgi:hypothetical protein
MSGHRFGRGYPRKPFYYNTINLLGTPIDVVDSGEVVEEFTDLWALFDNSESSTLFDVSEHQADVTVSDSLVVTDSAQVTIFDSKVSTDVGSLSESVSKSEFSSLVGTDALSLSQEISSTTKTDFKPASDSFSLAEIKLLDQQSSRVDSASLSLETVSVSRTQQVTASDTSVLNESASNAATLPVSDTFNLVEQSENQGGTNKAGTDSAGLAESAVIVVTIVRQDSSVASDLSNTLAGTDVIDLVTVSESTSLESVLGLVDSFSFNESTNTEGTIARSGTDSFALIDSSSLFEIIGGPWPVIFDPPTVSKPGVTAILGHETAADYSSAVVTAPYMVFNVEVEE